MDDLRRGTVAGVSSPWDLTPEEIDRIFVRTRRAWQALVAEHPDAAKLEPVMVATVQILAARRAITARDFDAPRTLMEQIYTIARKAALQQEQPPEQAK